MSEHDETTGLPPDEVVVETHGTETVEVTKETTTHTTPPTTNAFTVVRKATLKALAWGLVGALVALALTQAAFWIDNRSKNAIIDTANDTAASATKSVQELTTDVRLLREQLGEAQDEIATAREESDEVATCRQRYVNAITQAGQIHDLVFDRLVVAIGRASASPEEDADSILPLYQEIESRSLEWQEAIDARNAWEAAGAPLPCPIEQVAGDAPAPPTTGTG